MAQQKYGGRAKGTPNKDTQALIEAAERLGVNPFEILLHFAKGDFATLGYSEYQTRPGPDGSTYDVLTIEPELRARCAMKASEFLYPKRKAIEITDGSESRRGITLNYKIEGNDE